MLQAAAAARAAQAAAAAALSFLVCMHPRCLGTGITHPHHLFPLQRLYAGQRSRRRTPAAQPAKGLRKGKCVHRGLADCPTNIAYAAGLQTPPEESGCPSGACERLKRPNPTESHGGVLDQLA